jgi:ParB family chromosome partitioning protein
MAKVFYISGHKDDAGKATSAASADIGFVREGKKALPCERNGEQIVDILLTELFPPDFCPFAVNNDFAMQKLAKDIRERGVREPGIARKRTEGGYELLCGGRRKMACEIAGLPSLPVIVRDLDDKDAVTEMLDSNLQQRENMSPSEKAWAYRMKMEILNHNGVKADMNSVEVLVAQTGESKNRIYRLIRLTELVPDLIDMVDAKKIAFGPAVELSYLSRREQATVIEAMAKYDIKPSLSQAVRLKQLKTESANRGLALTAETIDTVLSECKKPPKSEYAGLMRFRKFFPPGCSPERIEAVIIKMLTDRNTRMAG